MRPREYKKMRNRLAFLGTLAGGLAHEIKNPLSAMSVNLQMLREDLEEAGGARGQRYLKRVNILDGEVSRLERILDGFLRFARGYSLNLDRQPLNPILREVIEFWAAQAKGQGIEVELVLAEDLPEVAVDSTYLKQSLLNLLNNAEQAITSKEDREPGADQIVVGSRARDGQVEILVIDSGPGIAAKNLDRIFEPYYSTKREKGSGLGLATARRIVEEHFGSLLVESEVGRGTSFTIRLPEAEKAEAMARAADSGGGEEEEEKGAGGTPVDKGKGDGAA